MLCLLLFVRTDVLPSIVELNRRLAVLVCQRVGHGDNPVVFVGVLYSAEGTFCEEQV